MKTILFYLVILLPSIAGAQVLRITPGAKLFLTGNVNIVLNNANLVNDGTITAAESKLVFTGNSTSNISGSSIINLKNVEINKPASQVLLNRNVGVSGTLNMINGNIDLGISTLELGNGGTIIGEKSQSRITSTGGGTVTAIRKWIPGSTVNPGNIGIELSTSNNLGVVTIVRRHQPSEILNGDETIARSYELMATNFIPIPDISLRFFYFDEELNNNFEDNLSMFARSGIGNFLLPIGADARNTTQNWVLKNGLMQLGFFSLGNDNTGPAISVFPNPAGKQVTLRFNSNQSIKVAAKLTDESGKVLQQRELSCQKGNNNIAWSLEGYAPGVYTISFDDKSFKPVKVVKY